MNRAELIKAYMDMGLTREQAVKAVEKAEELFAEREKGEWIPNRFIYTECTCNKCGKVVAEDGEEFDFIICPYCGAYMRGKDDE